MRHMSKSISAGLAFFLGIFGLALVFSDLGPDESWSIRIVIWIFFFFLSGFGLGFFNPKMWMISALTAGGGILLGGFIILVAIAKYGNNAFNAQEPPFISAGLTTLFVPLILALFGGYIGKQVAQMRKKLV